MTTKAPLPKSQSNHATAKTSPTKRPRTKTKSVGTQLHPEMLEPDREVRGRRG
jgi:hypothetical protein